MSVALYLLSFTPKAWLGKWYRAIFRYWVRVFIRALRVDLFLHEKNQRFIKQNHA